jgi:hypothetical protein
LKKYQAKYDGISFYTGVYIMSFSQLALTALPDHINRTFQKVIYLCCIAIIFFFFLCTKAFSVPPNTPVPAYPDGDTVTNSDVTLKWAVTTGAVSWVWEIQLTSGTIVDSGVQEGEPEVTISLENRGYRWRVSACNENYECSTWSNEVYGYAYFTVDANVPPVLSNGYVSPSAGDTETYFTFYVDYVDENMDDPDRIQVFINGDAYDMSFHSGNTWGGTYESDPVRLNAGTTYYYFEAEDVYGNEDREPSSGSQSLEVDEFNNAPDLSNPNVAPASGSVETGFIYSVRYTDDDGHEPSVIEVLVDGESYPLSFREGSGNRSDGIYERELTGQTLGVGSDHNYRFSCEDGHGMGDAIPLPGNDPLSGPTVEETEMNIEVTDFDTSPRYADPGETVTASFKFRNTGNVTFPSCEYVIFVNNIEDHTEFTNRSIKRGTFTTPVIAPGVETATINVEFELPIGVAAGWDYYAVIRADHENQIPDETNEGDNNQFSPIIANPVLRYLRLALSKVSSYSGDPVNTALGNFTYQHSDFSIPGSGLDINFTRYYNSQGGLDSPMGVYWSHSYNIYVHEDTLDKANLKYLKTGLAIIGEN